MKHQILLTISILIFAISTFAQTNQWRGENRSGNFNETNLLKSWPTNGPDTIWTNNQLPKGNSSVSFGNNKIYLTGFNDTNDILVALDTTGNIIWQKIYGRSWNQSFPEARCTPTIDGDKIFVSSGLGDIACLDGNTGDIIWSKKASEEFGNVFGEWGISESLIVDDKNVYFTPGGNETLTIALDKNNGNLVWKSKSLNDNPAYVSPILIKESGKKILVNITANYVYAINTENGEILWNKEHRKIVNDSASVVVWKTAPEIKCVTPLYSNKKIFVTGGYNHGSCLMQLTDDLQDVKTVWVDSVLDTHHGGVVLYNGKIYGSNWIDNGNGNWVCLDWETGKLIYEEKWKCKGSIIEADNMLYIYDEKAGNVGLVNPNTDKFEVISSFKVNLGSGPHWAHPVINNGKLYIRHGNALIVYKIKD